MSAADSDFESPRARKRRPVTRFAEGDVRESRGTGRRRPVKKNRRKRQRKAPTPSERMVRQLLRERTAKLAIRIGEDEKKVRREG